MTTAHITLYGDMLHAQLSDGTGFHGEAPAAIDFLRGRNIGAGSITMPNKEDPLAPTTGQRIAIISGLRNRD